MMVCETPAACPLPTGQPAVSVVFALSELANGAETEGLSATSAVYGRMGSVNHEDRRW